MSTAANHIERLRFATLNREASLDVAAWIQDNTTIGGQPFSFKGREFQEHIARDRSKEINVQKPSQVGVSELSARMALAMTSVVTPLTVIYTLPTSSFGATFMRTRIDPIIASSPKLKQSLSKTLDNAEVKCFNGESYLYVRGAASSNAPISIPADCLIHDEQSFCDQEVLTQYQSRLTASKWRLIRRFSTPTLPNYGIDREMKQSRRFFNMVKCSHCNHHFYPSYYDHVKIPGYSGDLAEINKATLARIRWREAKLLCPKCGREPDLSPKYRGYVQENDEDLVAAGYYISPFDAPTIITPDYLVQASTRYKRRADFDNFNLGITFDDKEATLSREDFTGRFQHILPVGTTVMGMDAGGTYHVVVARVGGYGDLQVMHTERVPQGLIRQRYRDLRREFRPACTVCDAYPHSETVMAMQAEDPNLYAGVYVRSKSMVTHTVSDKEEDFDEGMDFQRQVNINRSRAFDAYMTHIRDGKVVWSATEEEELIIAHHCDMKRIQIFDGDSGEMSYTWQKNTGEDHYHHAHLYAFIAAKIRGLSSMSAHMPFFAGARINYHR